MGEQTADVECASVKLMPSSASWSIAGVFSPIFGLNAETESIPMSSPRMMMTLGLCAAANVPERTAIAMPMVLILFIFF